MTATLPVNRIAGLIDGEERTPFPDPPQGEKEREAFWRDSLFDTIAALRCLLRSKDEHVVLASAQEILGLERTKMRHGKRVDGTGDGTMTYEESEARMDRTLRRNTPLANPASINNASETAVAEPESADEEPIDPAEAAACEAHVQHLQEVSGQWAAEMKLGDGLGMTRRQAIEFLMRVVRVTNKSALQLDSAILDGALRKMMLYSKEHQDAESAKQPNPANSNPVKASVSGG